MSERREAVALIVGKHIYGPSRAHIYRHVTLPCADEIMAADADHIASLEADRVELIEALEGAVKWVLVSDDPRSTKDLHVAEAVLRRIKEN